MAKHLDTGDFNVTLNKQIINYISDYPHLWYTTNYTHNDELVWGIISKEMGIQKTWLKKRWQTICKEYCNAQIYNDKHKHKPKHIKLAKQLKFLNVNKLKDLYKVNSMDDDSSNENDAEFCITQEILDKCEDDTAENCAATAADNENVEILNYEEEYIMQENDADHDKIEIICANDKDINELEELTPNKTATNEPEAECTQPPDDRNEDRIFGELVTAMLLRMGPSERRQAKKEIMNILL